MGAKFLTTTTGIANIELINLARGNKSKLKFGKIQELERTAVLTFFYGTESAQENRVQAVK